MSKRSQFISLILRHKPETIGLELDKHGWADLEDFIEKANAVGMHYTIEEIKDIVDNSEKKRFAISEDGLSIRARQGHSATLDVDVQLSKKNPPAVLYHGTASHFLPSIMKQGLIPKTRKHVHLSSDIETAYNVGKRHAKNMAVVILEIDTRRMVEKKVNFYLSENKVWLADNIPPDFLKIYSDDYKPHHIKKAKM